MTPEELNVEFPLGPDSMRQRDAPLGRLDHFTWTTSHIFPGTVRDYWVYVPAAYDAAKPACVFVVQDGKAHWQPERRWRIPTILDNLIHQKAIPVMIGVFINPGVIPAAQPGGSERINRSFEYDSLGDRYARFVLEEILPEVGRRYSLAQDGNSRAIMGGSSGAFCAFNAAWERPDGFSRVLSIVGSYTAMRGGNTLAPLVRVTEPKPLRVFVESGADDFKIFCGDWWTANLEMVAALEYAGYEVNHAWAEKAGHNDFHGSSIFPGALRWLWHDYPRPVQAGVNSQQPIARITVPGETWQLVTGEYMSALPITTNAQGEAVFVSPYENLVHRLDDEGHAEKFAAAAEQTQDFASGPDGRLYFAQPSSRRVLVGEATGAFTTWLEDIDAQGLAFAQNGHGYVSDPVKQCVWLVAPSGHRRVVAQSNVVTPSGDRRVVAKGVGCPAAMRVSPDQSQLIVTDGMSAIVWLFTILPDGGLANGAPVYRFIAPGDESTARGCGSLALSAHGWVAFATHTGLQFADRNGLIAGVMLPRRGQRVDGVALAGSDQSQLYVTDGRCVYRRKIRNAADLWC